jgi:WD40 repeat protein
VLLWDVRDPAHAELIARLPSEDVIGVAFSSDGDTLASSTGDHRIQLWDIHDRHAVGSPFATLTGPPNATGVVFEPGSHTIVGAAADGTALFWDIDSDAIANRICASHPSGTRQLLAPYLTGVDYTPVCPVRR